MADKGQLAMEFLLFIGIAFFVVFALMISTVYLSKDNSKIKAYHDMDDLGKSLQQEFLLATQLEDGYTRKINIPLSMDGLSYSVVLGQTNQSSSYFTLYYDDIELFYMIPQVNGTLHLGDNILSKHDGMLRVN